MPRLKSAIKRVKIYKRNRLRNLSFKSAIKTLVKKVSDCVEKKDLKSATDARNEAFSLIDRAQTKGIIHLNNAAHKKSKIATWLKKLEAKAN